MAQSRRLSYGLASDRMARSHCPDLPLLCPLPRPALQYVKIGIADPTINWIDLGASRRSAKVAIGFTGYPVRCGRAAGGGALGRAEDRQWGTARV